MSTKQLLPNALRETKVFVVDDEDILAWSIDTELRALGAEVMRAGSLREALERFLHFAPDLVITDLRLPDGNGLELLKKWRQEQPDLPVILITAHGAIDSAITALRLGAFDYLQKPFDMKDLIAAVRRASEIAKLRQKVSGFQGVEARLSEVEIVGQAPAVNRLRDQLHKIAKSKANSALVLGDSGTGKELAARAIHAWSDRSMFPFVEINCASIPETLLESELFGYERGAFTDARERKLGLFEIAKGGSIFLDEIGEMPFKLQAKLLRALEYRRFKRLGGVKDIEFSARIIAATNRNLRREVREQRFREDLYYRLNVLPIWVPRLKERLEDLHSLTEFFLGKLAAELELPRPLVTEAAHKMLMSYSWPGNIRELRNVLQRAMVFHEPLELRPEHLEFEVLFDEDRPQIVTSSATLHHDAQLVIPRSEDDGLPHGPLQIHVERPVEHLDSCEARTFLNPEAEHQDRAAPVFEDGGFRLPAQGLNLDELEKSLLTQALTQARNNQTRAAQLLGISRHTLRYRLEKHSLIQVNAGDCGNVHDAGSSEGVSS